MEILIEMYEVHVVKNLEMYFRIIVSALLGLFIGWDRSNANKPAGLKTYMYVSVACALITLVSIYSTKEYSSPDNGTMMDPMRLAAQIVTGLGFIGAGVILKDGLKVKGLTSAAMIFLAGGIGIGIGAGFYGIVIFSVIVSYFLARLSHRFEEAQHKNEETSDSLDDGNEQGVT